MSSEPQSVAVVPREKKSMTEDRLKQLESARMMALSARKEKADIKSKEKELAKLELAQKKKELDERLTSLNSPKPKPKKEKQIVYVDPSSSSESEDDEIEYVKRPKAPKAPKPKAPPRREEPVETQMSRAQIQDRIKNMRREQMLKALCTSPYAF